MMIRFAARFRQPILASLQARSSLQHLPRSRLCVMYRYQPYRALSTKKEGPESSSSGEETKDIVLTPGEKVVAATRLGEWILQFGILMSCIRRIDTLTLLFSFVGMWGGIFAFACVCGYYIISELMPT